MHNFEDLDDPVVHSEEDLNGLRPSLMASFTEGSPPADSVKRTSSVVPTSLILSPKLNHVETTTSMGSLHSTSTQSVMALLEIQSLFYTQKFCPGRMKACTQTKCIILHSSLKTFVTVQWVGRCIKVQ